MLWRERGYWRQQYTYFEPWMEVEVYSLHYAPVDLLLTEPLLLPSFLVWKFEAMYLLVIKPTRCINFSNLFLESKCTCFGQFLCPSSGIFHCTHKNGIYVIQLASRIRMELQFRPDPARKVTANLYDIYHCCVCSEKLLIMDRGTVRNM
jgi:hypothetical protein